MVVFVGFCVCVCGLFVCCFFFVLVFVVFFFFVCVLFLFILFCFCFFVCLFVCLLVCLFVFCKKHANKPILLKCQMLILKNERKREQESCSSLGCFYYVIFWGIT